MAKLMVKNFNVFPILQFKFFKITYSIWNKFTFKGWKALPVLISASSATGSVIFIHSWYLMKNKDLVYVMYHINIPFGIH